MRVEVRCGACERSYLVDETRLGGADTVACPQCASPIQRPATPREQPRIKVNRPIPTAVTPAATAEAATAPDPAMEEAPADEVVCPRCHLHFQPRKRQAGVHADRRPLVLVVEDQEYFREIARDALNERFEVRTAGTFDDAWAELVSGDVELLVLDLTLGERHDGRRLLEEMQLKPCPILIFTSRDESEMYGREWDELKALGADDMVLKGMNVGESLSRKACELLGLPVADDDD